MKAQLTLFIDESGSVEKDKLVIAGCLIPMAKSEAEEFMKEAVKKLKIENSLNDKYLHMTDLGTAYGWPRASEIARRLFEILISECNDVSFIIVHGNPKKHTTLNKERIYRLLLLDLISNCINTRSRNTMIGRLNVQVARRTKDKVILSNLENVLSDSIDPIANLMESGLVAQGKLDSLSDTVQIEIKPHYEYPALTASDFLANTFLNKNTPERKPILEWLETKYLFIFDSSESLRIRQAKIAENNGQYDLAFVRYAEEFLETEDNELKQKIADLYKKLKRLDLEILRATSKGIKTQVGNVLLLNDKTHQYYNVGNKGKAILLEVILESISELMQNQFDREFYLELSIFELNCRNNAMDVDGARRLNQKIEKFLSINPNPDFNEQILNFDYRRAVGETYVNSMEFEQGVQYSKGTVDEVGKFYKNIPIPGFFPRTLLAAISQRIRLEILNAEVKSKNLIRSVEEIDKLRSSSIAGISNTDKERLGCSKVQALLKLLRTEDALEAAVRLYDESQSEHTTFWLMRALNDYNMKSDHHEYHEYWPKIINLDDLSSSFKLICQRELKLYNFINEGTCTAVPESFQNQRNMSASCSLSKHLMKLEVLHNQFTSDWSNRNSTRKRNKLLMERARSPY